MCFAIRSKLNVGLFVLWLILGDLILGNIYKLKYLVLHENRTFGAVHEKADLFFTGGFPGWHLSALLRASSGHITGYKTNGGRGAVRKSHGCVLYI